jgi:hypothetical protein
VSFFSYALGAVVLILVLLRQARAVPVPRVYSPRLPVFLGVIGLFTLTSYAGDHHVRGGAWGWVLATLVVGAVGVGALRGLSMKVWTTSGWVLRQGTTVTMALWLVSVLLHILGDAEGSHAGGTGLVGASFLLYLGLTLGVQYYVVHRRAQPLWAQLGPDAGNPLVNFLQGFAQRPDVFFTTFRTGQGGPGSPGWGPAGPARPAHGDDVIDVEVVEDSVDGDDHGPPELHA